MTTTTARPAPQPIRDTYTFGPYGETGDLLARSFITGEYLLVTTGYNTRPVDQAEAKAAAMIINPFVAFWDDNTFTELAKALCQDGVK